MHKYYFEPMYLFSHSMFYVLFVYLILISKTYIPNVGYIDQ